VDTDGSGGLPDSEAAGVREIAASAFESADLLQGDPTLLGERILHQLFLPSDELGWRMGYAPSVYCFVPSAV